MKWWAGAGASVVGIESSAEAIGCAARNVPEALVLRGQCHTRIKQIDKIINENNFSDKRRLLYLNPPRTGLGEIVTDWILNEYRPGRIAYLSCSAGTLAKDLNKLTSEEYTVKKIIPYDFFPNTHHVETLVLIQKI
jgi:tRNA/tmRNA/rRNA uracil-C5-methylase (TrmA/RlmC/RlmD family)